MTPNRQDHEPRLASRNRREDFPRGYVQQPAFPKPETSDFDRLPLLGWLAISVLTVAAGVVGYFVLFDGPGYSGQTTDPGFRASRETTELPQLGQPAGTLSPEQQEVFLRPKSISSGTRPDDTLTKASSDDRPGAAEPEILIAAPQQIIIPPQEEAPRPAASPGELAHLLGQADTAMTRGDIAVARGFYETAYDGGSAEAATAMARTYDPLVLEEMAALGVQPDTDLAIDWYGRGEKRGDPRARQHLDALLGWLRARN